MKKNIVFVPMRSGSKGIPDKNIKKMGGLPLCYWALSAVQKSKKVDKIVVALDSEKYKEIIRGFAFDKIVFYDRKEENAQDNSSTESVMLEYFTNNESQKDTVILLQITNPLVTSEDVDAFIKLYKKGNYESLLTVSDLSGRFIWYEGANWTGAEPLNYNYSNRPRRQDMYKSDLVYMENGSMYINSVKNLLNSRIRLTEPVGLYIMPYYTLHEIDNEMDWYIIEKILEKV